MLGTTMTISSNNPTAFTYKAELVGAGQAGRGAQLRASARRPPVIRVTGRKQPTAVRLSDFKVAPKGGACP